MLVLTGDHRREYEIIADEIAKRTGAHRDVVAGMAHLVPDTGGPFNARLGTFLDHGE
ncbi:hypothetical protein [Amycolatopsis orientalis]|uniref:hypothetical protein n=1 Tax=Amycolatopsis orientalis TaxID=31958 RepID=UPI0004241C47|nr:hypothetical protein [Amycolatopsis orientalis]